MYCTWSFDNTSVFTFLLLYQCDKFLFCLYVSNDVHTSKEIYTTMVPVLRRGKKSDLSTISQSIVDSLVFFFFFSILYMNGILLGQVIIGLISASFYELEGFLYFLEKAISCIHY